MEKSESHKWKGFGRMLPMKCEVSRVGQLFFHPRLPGLLCDLWSQESIDDYCWGEIGLALIWLSCLAGFCNHQKPTEAKAEFLPCRTNIPSHLVRGIIKSSLVSFRKYSVTAQHSNSFLICEEWGFPSPSFLHHFLLLSFSHSVAHCHQSPAAPKQPRPRSSAGLQIGGNGAHRGSRQPPGQQRKPLWVKNTWFLQISVHVVVDLNEQREEMQIWINQFLLLAAAASHS